MRKTPFFLLPFAFFAACTPAGLQEKQTAVTHYFDLKDYIAKEANRLNARKPLVDKTVLINKDAENKQLKIEDWHKELSVFYDADINKSAWQGLFRVSMKKNTAVYESDNDKVPVKSLTVNYKNGAIGSIKILMATSNLLYTSNDTLSYFPDSLYVIRKTQRIRLLNEKNYRVTGIFKK